MPKEYDYIIIGAGLWGSVFAHEATKRGHKCLIVDKRNHTGGNIFCENKVLNIERLIQTQILLHLVDAFLRGPAFPDQIHDRVTRNQSDHRKADQTDK